MTARRAPKGAVVIMSVHMDNFAAALSELVAGPRKVFAVPALQPLIDRQWPMGVRYSVSKVVAIEEDTYRAWVGFKLVAAAWYLEALVDLEKAIGELDRSAGVEMALDGCVAAICSAFDAAVGALIESIQIRLKERLTDEWLRSWKHVREAVKRHPELALKCVPMVEDALRGGMPDPDGWLERFRRLRNRSIHRGTLQRDYQRPGKGMWLLVPGEGPVDPLPYLRESLLRTAALVDVMLDDAALVDSKVSQM